METWRSAECKRLVKEECPSPSSRIPDNVVVEWSPPRSEGLAEALSSPSPLETDEIDPKKNSIAALMGMSGQSRRRSSLSESQISASTFSSESPSTDTVSNSERSNCQMYPEELPIYMPTVPSEIPPVEKNLFQHKEEDLSSCSGHEHSFFTGLSSQESITVNTVTSPQISTTTPGSHLSVLDGFATLLRGTNHITLAGYENLPTRKGGNSGTQECETIEELFRSVEGPSDHRDITLSKIEEEDFDKLTEKTIEVYNKQNFVTRGFLAKLPDLQHTYLVGFTF